MKDIEEAERALIESLGNQLLYGQKSAYIVHRYSNLLPRARLGAPRS
jgi:hypothetical protein